MYKRLYFVVVLLASLGLCHCDAHEEDEANKTILNWSNKKITSTILNDYDFAKHPKLEEVDLSNNLIENIKNDKFVHNKFLKKLNLSGNTGLKLPEYASLLNTDVLEELNLSNCNIKEFPASILDGLTALTAIDLSNNPLNSVQLITFTNLLKLKKIILPNLDDKETIKEICNEIDITIEDSTKILPCKNVRNEDWKGIAKENITQSDTETEDRTKQAPVTNVQLNAVTDQQVDAPEETNDEPKSTDVGKKVLENTEVAAQPEKVETQVAPQAEPNSSTVEGVPSKSLNNTNDTQIVDTPEPALDNTPNAEETIEPNVVGNDNVAVPQQTELPVAPVAESAPQPDIPVAIQRGVPVPPTNEVKPQPNVPVIDMHRSAPISQAQDAHPVPTAIDQAQPNKPANIDQKQDNGSEASTGESKSQSTGTNILIFLVVAVIISGIAAFGYRFYKTRTYRPTSTQEPIERELQEIVTDKKSNGPAALGNVIEEEPLMQTNENSAEVKEDDEQKNNPSNINHTSNSKSYIPITSIPTKDNATK